MHKTEEKLILETLREEVEGRFGRRIEHSKDCRLLSERIFEGTNRQLSISTIKRFFDLISSPFNPSKYTLDTFALYVGFDNWNSYTEAKPPEGNEVSEGECCKNWKDKFHSISESSIPAIKYKSRYNPGRFIHRTFAERYFEDFIHSGKTATVLVAPKGYGKSVILLQWLDTYFPGKNGRYNDDLVCIIDGGMFFGIYGHSQNNEVLDQLLDFDIKKNQKIFSDLDNSNQKDYYFLIIDDVDKVYPVREKLYQIVGNIMQLILINKSNTWFKIILTCKPENLEIFTSLVLQNPLLEESFYNVDFHNGNYFDAINIPLFSRDEIKNALDNYENALLFNLISLQYPHLFKVISNPLYFSFFIENENSYAKGFYELDFINQLVQQIIYSPPFAEEKQVLIKKFLKLCITQKDKSIVGKGNLLEEINCRLAYQELIKTGILYEYFDPFESHGIYLKVSFASNYIFEYLLVKDLLKTITDDTTLLSHLFSEYKHDISLQYALLGWIVKIAFHEGNTEFLKQVHHFMERQLNTIDELNGETMPGSLRTIQDAFIHCLRSNSNSSEILMPWLAKSRLGRTLYFEEFFDMDNLMFFPEESLNTFARYSNTADGEMVIRFLRFIKGFYSLDYETCSLEFEGIKGIDFSSLYKPYSLGYYFASYYLYATINNNRINNEMLDMIISGSHRIRQKHPQNYRFVPPFELFIIYNMNTCDLFEEVHVIAEYIEKNVNFTQMNSSCFYQFFKLCQARSLLNSGEPKQALELFRHIEIGVFPAHIRHFMELNVNLAQIDFFNYQRETSRAFRLLYETRTLAKQMGYRFFVQKTSELELKL